MTAAALVAVERVIGNELAHCDEVVETERLVELYVHALLCAWHEEVIIECLADIFEFSESEFKTFLVAGHAHIFPHDVAELLVDRIDRAFPFDVHEAVEVCLAFSLRCVEFRSVG